MNKSWVNLLNFNLSFRIRIIFIEKKLKKNYETQISIKPILKDEIENIQLKKQNKSELIWVNILKLWHNLFPFQLDFKYFLSNQLPFLGPF